MVEPKVVAHLVCEGVAAVSKTPIQRDDAAGHAFGVFVARAADRRPAVGAVH